MQAVGNARSADAARRTEEVKHEISNGLIPSKVVEALNRDDAREALDRLTNPQK